MAPRITAGAPPNAEPDQSLTQLPPPRQSTTLLRRARLSPLVACGVIACSLGFTIKGSTASPEFSAKGVLFERQRKQRKSSPGSAGLPDSRESSGIGVVWRLGSSPGGWAVHREEVNWNCR